MVRVRQLKHLVKGNDNAVVTKNVNIFQVCDEKQILMCIKVRHGAHPTNTPLFSSLHFPAKH